MNEQAVSSTATYKRLLTHILPYWKIFILGMLCNVAYAFIDTSFIRALQPLLDEGLIGKDPDYVTLAPTFIMIALVLRGIFGFISAYCMSWVGNTLTMEIRNKIFGQYLKLPAQFFDSRKTGELLSKVIYNTDQLNRSTTDAITRIVRDLGMITFAIWGMVVISWELTLIYLVTAPLIAIVVTVTTRRFKSISRRIQDSMGDITQVTQEGIEAYQEIKIYGGNDFELNKFSQVNAKNRNQSMKMEVTKAFSIPIIQILAGVGLSLVLYFAMEKVINGVMSTGDFVAIIALMMFILKPLKSLSSVNVILQRGIAAADSIFEVLDQPLEKDEGNLPLKKVQGDIRFSNVCFSYPLADKPALKNINIEIAAGQTIALVGRSGSGKSTLASILLRFYNIDSGAISLDGINIEDYQLLDYRQHIAFVSQHITLFNDTIAHNVAYGKLGSVTEEEIIEVCKKAHAWEFIKELPDGLETMVGERGMLLSGGQRQRIAIARAILKDAAILILDEATSALDTTSEKYIQEAMQTVMHNRTTVVVAHRLSTIENADHILVMDHGSITEVGNHAQLLKLNGVYAGLHQMQFKA